MTREAAERKKIEALNEVQALEQELQRITSLLADARRDLYDAEEVLKDFDL